jgi:hypothetical protein
LNIGKKVKKFVGRLFLWAAAVFAFFFVILLIYMHEEPPAHRYSAAAERKPFFEIDKSPEIQTERKQFLENLVAKGLFYAIDMPGSLVHVRVSDSFLVLDHDTQFNFYSVVYCYFYDGMSLGDCVVVKNAKGWCIGSFSLNSGIEYN